MQTLYRYEERVLSDDYPVYYGYFYVAGDKVIRSNLGDGATVVDLKRLLGVTEIKSCDAVGRGLL
jgi:hypothetical protein